MFQSWVYRNTNSIFLEPCWETIQGLSLCRQGLPLLAVLTLKFHVSGWLWAVSGVPHSTELQSLFLLRKWLRCPGSSNWKRPTGFCPTSAENWEEPTTPAGIFPCGLLVKECTRKKDSDGGSTSLLTLKDDLHFAKFVYLPVSLGDNSLF